MSVDIRQMVRSDPRRAGAVKRYHTWPTIQIQTVAEASWNVARILVMIWPHAPSYAITNALLNDCGEIKCGDLPFPIKRDNPVLKEEISRIEDESFKEQGISHLLSVWSEDWMKRIKVCDMLEMWEFGLEEVTMGNQYAQPIVEGTMEETLRLAEEVYLLMPDDIFRIREYIKWRNEKTPTRRL